MTEKYWRIRVRCWGTLFAIGTEAQAEQWREHKGNWEGCLATKREATVDEIRDNKFTPLSELICILS